MHQLGRLGVWAWTDHLSAQELAEFGRKLEEWNYGALWYPEARGRDPLAQASWLLSNTQRLQVCTGIANIYARDAQAAQAARLTLNEQSLGRFVLGLGVSHKPLVEGLRGHTFDKPLAAMRRYLEAMKKAVYDAPMPAVEGEVIVAALGPQMLKLAGELSHGAHPYNVTPAHTERARKILGPNKALYVEQKVLLVDEPQRARAISRQYLSFYLGLPAYRNNLLSLGFDEQDLNQASDRLMDALVAWGDETALRKRIHEHWEAGADHVCIQPLSPNGEMRPDLAVLELLAPSQEAPST